MIRKLSIALVVMSALAITAGAALAANPHYVGPKTPTASIDSSTGSLSVNFKAAGYGSGVEVNWWATFNYSITWGCLTPKKNNEPSGLKSSSGGAAPSGTELTNRTGTLTGPITLFNGDTGFSCPSPNQHEVLISASYTDIVFYLDEIDGYSIADISYP